MHEAEFWEVVFPTWLGGVGGLAAAAIGTIALIKSLKTQGGVETLKGAANAPSGSAPAPSPSTPPVGGIVTPPIVSPVSWTTWHESRGKYKLRNDSTNNGASAELTGFKDVTPGGDNAAAYHGPLPVTLAAGESAPFSIEKTLVSPSVTAVELTWKDPDGTPRSRNVYI